MQPPAQTPSSTPGCILNSHRPASTPISNDADIVIAPAMTSVMPLSCTPRHEIRAGIEPDDGDESGESDGLENPQCRPRDAAEQAWSHGAQPAADEPAEQDADRQAQPDLDAADVQRRQSDQCAGDDAGRDDEHVRHVSGTIRHADEFDGAGHAVPQADDGQHVAAMHDGIGHQAE